MKKVLIAIDLQNDFIDEALGTKEAVDIVEACVQKIRSYQGDFVFATMDTHAENYLETAEGKHLPIVHCVKSTHGWSLMIAYRRHYKKWMRLLLKSQLLDRSNW